MIDVLIYSLISVLVISLLSIIGILALSIRNEKLEKMLIYMIAFSAGALIGDAFIHLLPEAVEKSGFVMNISLLVLLGIGFSLVVEKVIHWRHCHHVTTNEHPHHLSSMNLIGDGVHNLIDGLIIGASYIVSIPIGIATTIAVIFHEIPQEIGDFGVLVYGGYTKKRALFFNFLISLTAFIGLLIALSLGSFSSNLTYYLLPFAAGNFIYIACSDLIPELHRDKFVKLSHSFGQLVAFVLGILIMVLLKTLG
ncbi:MAG: ZIP family metal transporter [Candidatus Pacearchaeota archaeon]|jgi:zinc and cadmium transporter